MYSQIVKDARIQSVERVGKSMSIRCAFVVCINYYRRAKDREREMKQITNTLAFVGNMRLCHGLTKKQQQQ